MSDGFDREQQEVESLFEEDVRLTFHSLSGSYCVWRVESVNGVEPKEMVIVWYYYDEYYLPFDVRTPNLAGKLSVCITGSREPEYDRYYPNGNCGGMSYNLKNNYEENSVLNNIVPGLIVPAENKIGSAISSIASFLGIGFSCTYPKTGCRSHWSAPEHDLEEAMQVARWIFAPEEVDNYVEDYR